MEHESQVGNSTKEDFQSSSAGELHSITCEVNCTGTTQPQKAILKEVRLTEMTHRFLRVWNLSQEFRTCNRKPLCKIKQFLETQKRGNSQKTFFFFQRSITDKGKE